MTGPVQGGLAAPERHTLDALDRALAVAWGSPRGLVLIVFA